ERELFIAAQKITEPTERAAWLDRECGDDAALRQRIDVLLRAFDQAGSLLEHPAVAVAPERVAAALGLAPQLGPTAGGTPPGGQAPEGGLGFLAPARQAGRLGLSGHLRLPRSHRQGRHGVVLRAFDEKLHRVVAVKVMASQLATNGTARKRFTREAQAAA